MTAYGVFLLNMGGPSSLDEVKPFLVNLFSDNDIIPLPIGPRAQRVFGTIFGSLRGRRDGKVARSYAAMGGGSPQRRESEMQARALAARLDAEVPEGAPWKTYVCMRYAAPMTDEAIAAARRDGVDTLVVLPLYPQYSATTTGSNLNELARQMAVQRWRPRTLHIVRDYHDDPAYQDALAASVARTLEGLPAEKRAKAHIFFSAHSIPMRVVNAGDLYPPQIEATTKGVMERLRKRGIENAYTLAWQSRVRPFTEWLGPQTDDTIRALAAKGEKHLLVVPVAFVGEHIETLVEIDEEYGELARSVGIETFVRVPCLRDDAAFIGALAGIVRRAAGFAAPEREPALTAR